MPCKNLTGEKCTALLEFKAALISFIGNLLHCWINVFQKSGHKWNKMIEKTWLPDALRNSNKLKNKLYYKFNLYRRQAIIWTNAGILSIGPLGTNFSENINRNLYISIQENASENAAWKMMAILPRRQWVNSLRPSNAYMRPVPSPYLNQYWDIVNCTLMNKI